MRDKAAIWFVKWSFVCISCAYLFEVEVFFWLQESEFTSLVLRRTNQQIVKHVVVPVWGVKNHYLLTVVRQATRYSWFKVKLPLWETGQLHFTLLIKHSYEHWGYWRRRYLVFGLIHLHESVHSKSLVQFNCWFKSKIQKSLKNVFIYIVHLDIYTLNLKVISCFWTKSFT